MSELQEIKISWGMIEIFYGNIGALFSENFAIYLQEFLFI